MISPRDEAKYVAEIKHEETGYYTVYLCDGWHPNLSDTDTGSLLRFLGYSKDPFFVIHMIRK